MQLAAQSRTSDLPKGMGGSLNGNQCKPPLTPKLLRANAVAQNAQTTLAGKSFQSPKAPLRRVFANDLRRGAGRRRPRPAMSLKAARQLACRFGSDGDDLFPPEHSLTLGDPSRSDLKFGSGRRGMHSLSYCPAAELTTQTIGAQMRFQRKIHEAHQHATGRQRGLAEVRNVVTARRLTKSLE